MCSIHTKRLLQLTDRRFWFHVAGLVVLLLGLFAPTVFGQEPAQVSIVPAHPTSLVDKWLAPDIALPLALALLYVGELRGELKRLKNKAEQFDRFMSEHDEKMEKKFMLREIVESRLRELKHKHATESE